MKILYLVLRVLTLVLVLVVLACLLGAKISPLWFPYSSLCSLIFPYAYGGLFIWGVVMVFVRWQNTIIVAVMILVGYSGFSYFFVFPNKAEEVGSNPHPLRVLSWNVGNFSYNKEKYNTEKTIQDEFFKTLEKANADVICLQEVWIAHRKENWLTKGLQKRGYTYSQYAKNSLLADKNVYYGCVIFSRYPMRSKSHTVSSLRSQLVDVSIIHPSQKRKIHIFSIHLQSNKINSELIENIKELNIDNKESLNAAITFSDKLSSNSRVRYSQIEEVLAICSEINEPSIFCIDLNDLAGSYNYHKLGDGRLDAFREKGAWFRTTFPRGFTSVGIDFIFSDTTLAPKAYRQLNSTLSDHLPHYADF